MHRSKHVILITHTDNLDAILLLMGLFELFGGSNTHIGVKKVYACLVHICLFQLWNPENNQAQI